MSIIAATPAAIMLTELGALIVWKFPSERLAEKIAEARERVLERGRQEGREELVQELKDRGFEVPQDLESEQQRPPPEK